MHNRRGDCFEKLVEWIEIRVQIMDETKETGQLIDRHTQERETVCYFYVQGGSPTVGLPGI